MVSLEPIELPIEQHPYKGLSERILNGEFFMLREGLQKFGLYEELKQASFQGICDNIGKQRADEVMSLGVEQIHKVVTPDEIPNLTHAVYSSVEKITLDFLKKFTTQMFGDIESFYFERKANVRFHIPFDDSAAFQSKYRKFSKRSGDGKITPHRAHRDTWVDCPSNVINIWVAVGKVSKGNGLTIYPEVYSRDVKHEGAYISADENPGPAATFDMQPGDILMFHSDHVHGSEINMTGDTRHVISFRISLEKPDYKLGHYHHYAWSGLAGGPLDFLAGVPQNLAWSYVRYKFVQFGQLLRLLSGRGKEKPVAKVSLSRPEPNKQLSVSDLKQGDIIPWSKSICVTRLENGDVKAFGRYCPHEGADLACGVMLDDQVKCPFHNLDIDPVTGKSPCASLKHLKTYPVEIVDDKIIVREQEAAA